MMGRILGRLVKRFVVILAIGTVGTVLGWGVVIVIEEIPLWMLIVALMIGEVVLFAFARWSIQARD